MRSDSLKPTQRGATAHGVVKYASVKKRAGGLAQQSDWGAESTSVARRGMREGGATVWGRSAADLVRRT